MKVLRSSRLLVVVLGLTLMFASTPQAFAQFSFPSLGLDISIDMPDLGDIKGEVFTRASDRFNEVTFPDFPDIDLFPHEDEHPDPDPAPSEDPDETPDPTPGPNVGMLSVNGNINAYTGLILVTGAEDYMQQVMELSFVAQDEAVRVDTLTFAVPADLAGSVREIVLQYPGESGPASASASLSAFGKAMFTELGAYIPADGAATMGVFVRMKSLEDGSTRGVQGRVSFDADADFKATGLSSGYVDTNPTDSQGLVKGQDDITSVAFTVRVSAPKVTTIALPTDELSNGEMVLSDFSIEARGSHVALSKLSWDFTFTRDDEAVPMIQLSHLRLIDADQPETVLPIKTMTFRKYNQEGSLEYFFNEEQLVMFDTTKHYQLIADVSGVQDGDSMSSTLVGDTTLHEGDAETVGESNYFVWSDLAGHPHEGFDSTDWLNGAGVAGLPAAEQSLAR